MINSIVVWAAVYPDNKYKYIIYLLQVSYHSLEDNKSCLVILHLYRVELYLYIMSFSLFCQLYIRIDCRSVSGEWCLAEGGGVRAGGMLPLARPSIPTPPHPPTYTGLPKIYTKFMNCTLPVRGMHICPTYPCSVCARTDIFGIFYIPNISNEYFTCI